MDYLMLRMRDGIRLETVVVRPKGEGKYPVILSRTPYVTDGLLPLYGQFLQGQYALVIQNERGSKLSEGEFGLLRGTTRDAQDTLDWIAAQPWSNGRVGTEGCSSTAENQLRIGAIGHPALKALIPMSSGAGVGTIPGADSQGLAHQGGAPRLSAWSMWYAPFGYRFRPKLPQGLSLEEETAALRNFSVASPTFLDKDYAAAITQSLTKAPSIDVLRRMGTSTSEFEEHLAAAPRDPTWRSLDVIDASYKGSTPSLNINGWYDIGAYETVKLFEFQQEHPDQYLIMAPTGHCRMTVTSADAKVGDRPVGDSTFPYPVIIKSWFDRFLAADAKTWKPMPKVQVFVPGANGWIRGDRWPLKDTSTQRFYLDGSDAVSLFGDGTLAERPGSAASDLLRADPANPTPSLGDPFYDVVKDRRPVESRRDLLVYSTPVLDKGLTIAGDISATLYLESATPDADVVVTLVDVYPDGTAYNVQTGVQRLRYRDGFDRAKLLQPGQVYEVKVGGMVTANHFAPGHRMRVEVAAYDFPRIDRNWNTGGKNETETKGPLAQLRIHHGGERASFVEVRRYTGPAPALLAKAGAK